MNDPREYAATTKPPLPPHEELTQSISPDEPGSIFWLFHNTAPNIPPTYNHTRGDSPRYPCEVCKERKRRMTP